MEEPKPSIIITFDHFLSNPHIEVQAQDLETKRSLEWLSEEIHELLQRPRGEGLG